MRIESYHCTSHCGATVETFGVVRRVAKEHAFDAAPIANPNIERMGDVAQQIDFRSPAAKYLHEFLINGSQIGGLELVATPNVGIDEEDAPLFPISDASLGTRPVHPGKAWALSTDRSNVSDKSKTRNLKSIASLACSGSFLPKAAMALSSSRSNHASARGFPPS